MRQGSKAGSALHGERMRFGKSATTALLIVAALLLVRLWLSATDVATRPTMAVSGGIVVVLLLAIGVSIPLFELTGRRKNDAERLQHILTRRVRRAFRDLPVTVDTHVRESGRRWMVIEIRGSVPTEDVRDRVLRTVQHEAFRLGCEVRVVDRLGVRSAADKPAA